MNETLDDLIQRVLDGEATAGEQTRLESLLASDPAARARHDELSRVFAALAPLPSEDPPAGLRDEVMRAVRGAAPAWAPSSARAGRASSEGGRAVVFARPSLRPSFSWLRIALPAAAAAVAAVVLFANWRGGPQGPGGDGVTGAMTEIRPHPGLRLGEGADAVHVTWGPAENGFRLTIRTGNAPVRVALDAQAPGALLALPPGAPTPSPRIEATLPANALVVAEGTGPASRATIRVSITLPDGQVATGEIGPPASSSR